MKKRFMTALLIVVLLLGISVTASAKEWSGGYNLINSPAPDIQVGDTLLTDCGFHGYVYVSGDYNCSNWADWAVGWGRAHQVARVNSVSFNGSEIKLNITYFSQDEYPDDRHVAGEITYTWDGDVCTATTMCARTPAHEIKETVTGTYVKDTDATCVSPETGHLHAVFTNTILGTADTEVGSVTKGSPKAHEFKDAEYIWDDDECTATRVCGNCPENETETVTGTYVTDSAVNCLEAETGHYEAEFKNEAFAKQSTDAGSVVKGDPLGHDYGKPSYSWKGNACTGMYVCARCADTVSETVKCEFVQDTEATCTEKKTGSYTAEFEDETLETQYLGEVEKGHPLGHDWGRWKQIREATVSAKGQKQRFCARCGAMDERWQPRVTWLADDEEAVPMTLTETDEGLTVEPEQAAEDALTLKMSAADIAQALSSGNETLILKDGIEVVLDPALLQNAMQETGADTLLVTVEPVAAEEADLPDGAIPASGVLNVTVQLLRGDEAVEADPAEFSRIRVPEAFAPADTVLCLFGADGEWQELAVEHAQDYLCIGFAGNGLYVLVK